MTEKVSSGIALERLVKELKNARMEKNLSLEDVNRLTTIQKSYLANIEEGDFGFLPRIYIFTFIKEYAILMGVGNDEIFEQCKKELLSAGAPKDDVPVEKDFIRTEKQPGKQKTFQDIRVPRSFLLLIIGIILVVVAGFLLFYSNSKLRSSAHPSPSVATLPSVTGEDTVAVAEQIVDSLMMTSSNKPAPNVAPLTSHKPSKPKVDSVSTSSPSPKAHASSASVVTTHAGASNSREWAKHVSLVPSSKSSPYRKVLVVRLIEDHSWVKVVADDSARVYPGGKFTKGQVLRYEARKKFWVNIGRPRYVELYLNGKKIPQTTDRILIIH
jgi:cytoskeleton protein RodZ